MFSDLLDYARGSAGKLALDVRAVEIGGIATAAVDAIRAAATEKSLEVVLHTPSGGVALQGDATRLRQVLDSLLSNAVKYTPRGGKVTVAIAHSATAIVIEVQDTGRGISPELASRVFEPFAQAHSGPTRREAGLGLGLTIARQLIELHRGTLEVASPGVGQGTTVTIHLPVPDARDRAAPPRTARGPNRLDGTHVLVVDDDAGVRRGLAVLLERLGVHVDVADSASTARQQIANRAPQAVICDIAMPDEDGYSFVRCLRRSGVDVPSIALTAFATEDDVHRALDAGFDAHLTKPIRIERLVDTLSEVLASQRNCSST
jgi:CheY-like chemotaxis protein/anti-sigma regulatory factor (Ser/Thr protein kinase)